MRRRIALLLLLAACGSKQAASGPSADVVIADVDGGTVATAAAPDSRRIPKSGGLRALTPLECKAYVNHMLEALALETQGGMAAVRRSRYDPEQQRKCDAPIYSDEIFDCILAATSLDQISQCMDPAQSPRRP